MESFPLKQCLSNKQSNESVAIESLCSNKMIRYFVFLTLIVAFITLCLLIFAYTKPTDKLNAFSSEVKAYTTHAAYTLNTSLECTSKACYSATSFISNHLNQSVGPCDNFYEISCGESAVKKNYESDHFTMAINNFLTDLADVLGEPKKSTDSLNIMNFKMFYQSCMNETDVELYSDMYFLEFMRSEFGEWPLIPIEKRNLNKFKNNLNVNNAATFLPSTRYGIENYLAKITILEMPFVFRFQIDVYEDLSLLMKLNTPEDFCVMQNFLPKTPRQTDAFYKLMKKISVLLLNSLNHNEKSYLSLLLLSTDLDDEKLFNTQIAEMLRLADHVYFLNDSKYRCGTKRNLTKTNLYTINQLNDILNANGSLFNFSQYFDYLNQVSLKKLDPATTQVIISEFSLNWLLDLLNGLSFNMTRVEFERAFVNLLYFHSMFQMLKPVKLFTTPHYHMKFPFEYYQVFFEYEKLFNQNSQDNLPLQHMENFFRLKLEQNCAHAVYQEFSTINSGAQFELQHFFISKKFDRKKKTYAKDMFKNLVATAIEIMDMQDWIEHVTKQNVKLSINTLVEHIAYSDLIDEYFQNAKSNKNAKNSSSTGVPQSSLTDHFIINIFLTKQNHYKQEFELVNSNQMETMRNRNTIIDLFSVNLYYFEQFNIIMMPAGILYDPIFNLDYPSYLNYATIGVYLAHEIWHFIEKELLKNIDEKSILTHPYLQHLECLTQNYQKFVKLKYGKVIAGYTSVDEQIADNFGLLVSLLSYFKLAEHNEASDIYVLPNLDYNQVQLFFIRHSESYCRLKMLKSINFDGTHPIHDYRAFQTSLIPSFKKYFSCQKENNLSIKSCQIFKI